MAVQLRSEAMVQRVKNEGEISWDVETDVAVVGGGACGLASGVGFFTASQLQAGRGREEMNLIERRMGG